MLKKHTKRFYVLASLMFFLLVLVFVFGETPKIDGLVSQWVVNSWDPFSSQVFIFFGYALKPLMIFIGLLVIFMLYQRERKKDSLILFVALTSGYILEQLIKIIVQRERPTTQLVEELSYSFPSGRAVFSVILFSLLIYFYKDEIKNQFHKRMFILSNIFLILLVGFSRIYLNVHWFSDVIGGFFLGLFILSTILFVAEKTKKI